MKCKVSVEKRMYATGVVEVDCDNAEQAFDQVQREIADGHLLDTDIEWSEPVYEGGSMTATEDID